VVESIFNKVIYGVVHVIKLHVSFVLKGFMSY